MNALSKVVERILERHDASHEEVLDALWFNRHLAARERQKAEAESEKKREASEEDRDDAEAERADEDTGTPDPKRSADPTQGPGESQSVSEGLPERHGEKLDKGTHPQFREVLATRFGAVLAEKPRPGTAQDRSAAVEVVHLPGGIPFELQRDDLVRAFRPLRLNRVADRGELDEEATAHRFARTGLMQPVWKETFRDAMLLTLIVEQSPSTAFWTAWARELQRIIRAGSRNRVELLFLRANQEADGPGFEIGKSARGTALNLSLIGTRQPPRQILLFSDLVAPWWKSGHLPAVLEDWAAVHPVTVFNPAPPRFWERTAYRKAEKGPAVVRRHQARWKRSAGDAPSGRRPIFLARLEPGALRNWARTVTVQPASSHLAFSFAPADPAISMEVSVDVPEIPILPAGEIEERVLRAERGLLTPQALQLLQVLASVPLTPAIMRLIQAGVFPGLTHEHLAEVLYSRLVARQGPQKGRSPDQVHYDLYREPGEAVPSKLRQRLLGSRQWGQLQLARTLVIQYLAAQTGISEHRIDALVRGHGQMTAIPFPPELEDFLILLGGTWRAFSESGGRLLDPGEIYCPETLRESGRLTETTGGASGRSWILGAEDSGDEPDEGDRNLEAASRDRDLLPGYEEAAGSGLRPGWELLTWPEAIEEAIAAEDSDGTRVFWADRDREGFDELPESFRKRVAGPVPERLLLQQGSEAESAALSPALAPWQEALEKIARSPSHFLVPEVRRSAVVEPAPPAADRPEAFTNTIGMQMLGIPSGSFTMGSPEHEDGRDADDFAEHGVTLTEPFHVAETPVTQGQWKEITGRSVAEQKALGSDYGEITGTGDDHPIVFVSWEDALRFCDTLTERERAAGNLGEDRAYTLPTDAQWEYACRAGTWTPYNLPNAEAQELGWFSENSSGSTQPVGKKKANAWGLRDCHGNAWEWCADWFERSESREPEKDPEGPETGDFRVLRGGCWFNSAQLCRSAYRLRLDPGLRFHDVGFRPVLASASQRAKLPVLEAEAKPEPEAGKRSEEFRSRDYESSIGLEMVCLPPGTFRMGSPEEEEGREPGVAKETRHEVTLTESFHIASKAVTQGQWREMVGRSVEEQKVLGNAFGEVTGVGDDHPVYFVNWEEALRFCDALTGRDREAGSIEADQAYTLPLEAQWEYACRAGTDGSYNVDGKEVGDLGWYAENSEGGTHPVGEKHANRWDLHDCHGNVYEWCADWYEEDLGAESALDPEGTKSGDNRVLRGGSWRSSAQHCRSAYRFRYVPGNRSDYVGFRPVLAPASQRAKLPALEAEAKPEPEAGKRSGPHGMTFLPIRAGTFRMGSPESEEGRYDDEDCHEVTLTRDYEMAKTPVTQEQWEAVMGKNPSRFAESGPDAPVEQVSWDDARDFCKKLSAGDARFDYRLSTEAEWEYACRAGTAGPYNVDGAELEELGWYSENADGKTHPVGEKRPNVWGLHDMHGNVREWCEDRFGEHLGTEPVTDPHGPEEGDSRVLRGGCWDDSARYCRSAYRGRFVPGYRDYNVGFRPVRQPKKQAKLPALEAEAKPEPEAGERSGPHGMAFLPIRAGTFMMGSPESEEGRYEDEDLHEVTLTRHFEMAETLVTQGQWMAVMGGENPSRFVESGLDTPVEQVSWDEARRFCKRLSAGDAEFDYRLPTEAEWEYACRAGTEGPYNVKGAELEELGWYDGNADEKTHPVGEKRANVWGLHDMHGNVWEWCVDRFAEHLGTAPVRDPQGPEVGDVRVLRGGCWYYSARYCRSAYRNGYEYDPGDRRRSVGIRLVRQPKKEAKPTEAEGGNEKEHVGLFKRIGKWLQGTGTVHGGIAGPGPTEPGDDASI